MVKIPKWIDIVWYSVYAKKTRTVDKALIGRCMAWSLAFETGHSSSPGHVRDAGDGLSMAWPNFWFEVCLIFCCCWFNLCFSCVYIYMRVYYIHAHTHTHIYIYTYQLHFLKLQCECVPFNQRLYRWISEYSYVYFLSIPMYGHPHSSFQMSSIRQAITGHSRVLDIPPVAWRSLGEEFWRIHLLVFWLSRSHKKPPMGGWSSLYY